jgi:hypothetical protein
VSLWIWIWMWDEAKCSRLCMYVCVLQPHDLGQCSHLLMGSLGGNDIGALGAQYLGAALQVNTTLTDLG